MREQLSMGSGENERLTNTHLPEADAPAHELEEEEGALAEEASAREAFAFERPESVDEKPAATPNIEAAATADVPEVIAVASGKGGVGKSVLASSFAIFLAQIGKRVIAVDANFGSGNLHTLVGVDRSLPSLERVCTDERPDLGAATVPTPFEGLTLISGQDDGVDVVALRPVQKKRFLGQLHSLRCDHVIMDVAPGSTHNSLDTFLAADVQVVVVTPQPTAIESAFRLIKSAFIRKVRQLPGFSRLHADVQPHAFRGVPTPLLLVSRAEAHGLRLASSLAAALADFRPLLVVNQTRTRDDLELGLALETIARRHLGVRLKYAGYVESNDLVEASVRRRQPLLLGYPEAKVSKDIERVIRRILAMAESKDGQGEEDIPKSLAKQDHYDLLGLQSASTEEEVRRAYRQVKRLYSPASNAVFGIVPPKEIEEVLSKLEEAYTTLIDADRRQQYNQALSGVFERSTGARAVGKAFPTPSGAGAAPGELRHIVPADELNVPLPGPDGIYDGALLRQVRLARGLDLRDLANATKIAMVFLQAIEDDDLGKLPSPVYLRGFVKAISRALKLDAERVVKSYMQNYQRMAAGSSAADTPT